MLAPLQGLSHCYVKGDDGKLVDQFVIEPINANSIECMANGGQLPGWPVQRDMLGLAAAALGTMTQLSSTARCMPRALFYE